MKKSNVEKNLIDSSSENIPEVCVAACVFPRKDGYPFHAGLAVCIGEERTFFHFDAVDIKEEGFNKYPFMLKEFETIPPFEADAFRVICRSAIKNAAPKYHYLFDGSHYKEGTFEANNGTLSYHMTCVGFCLAVLKEWFDEDYINFTDWTAENSLKPEKIEEQTRLLKEIYPDFTEEDLQKNMRRIKPSELIASAFLGQYPINKKDTDGIAEHVQNVFMDWHKSMSN